MSKKKKELVHRLEEHLVAIYPDEDHSALSRTLIDVMGLEAESTAPASHRNLWDQSDSLLITYGKQHNQQT